MNEAEQNRELEQEFRASRERLTMVAAASADAVWDCDLTTGSLWRNQRFDELFGEIPTQSNGSWDWKHEKVHTDDRERVAGSLLATLGSERAGDLWSQEYRYRRNDGQYAHVRERVCIARDAAGATTRVVGVIQDVTKARSDEERRQILEEQIQQAQKLESLGVLAGGIAHDFNNLLMGILGNSDLALNELSATSPAGPYVERIQATAVRAADLCKQMLAYSGKGKFVIKSFDLNELVEDMVRLLEVSISKSAILNFNLSEYLPPIEGDLTQVRQVVMNLVTNASEAIGDKSGVITITTGVMEADSAYLAETYLDERLPEGVYAYLEVSDTGSGMDQETLSKIFDPFFSTKFSGRGLGLAAVLGIVRGHQGAFKVYSQPGKGTTMKALFPVTDSPLEAIAEDPRLDDAWRPGGTILVVDDEETVRVVAKKMLEYRGFDVLIANDGREALERFRSHREEISAVLLDMTMPHLGGEETFRELRRLEANVKVVMMSGYNEQEVTSKFSGKGLAGFIQKPFGQRGLLDKLKEVLDGPTAAQSKVLLIDNDRARREMTKAALESLEFQVHRTGTAQAGLGLLKGTDFDVVLLGSEVSGLNVEAIQEMRSRCEALVLLLAPSGSSEASDFADLGFTEILQRPVPIETLVESIRTATQPSKG